MRLIDIAGCHLQRPIRIKIVDQLDLGPTGSFRYAILSHCWQKEEVTLQDLTGDTWLAKAGAAKLLQAIDTAQSLGYGYLWSDTCCIDKSSSSELSEAINSMFSFYSHASVCLAFLHDVDSTTSKSAVDGQFEKSDWFTRGWTLQELLAPQNVVFYCSAWQPIGSKNDWAEAICTTTGIAVNVLRGVDDINMYSIATKMSWAAHRQTQRIEDIAYSLLGIFEVNMPLLYGEGDRAFIRLQEEILKRNDDCTLYAWRREKTQAGSAHIPPARCGLLATSPHDFQFSAGITPYREWRKTAPVAMTNRGLEIELGVTMSRNGNGTAVLPCAAAGTTTGFLGIRISPVQGRPGRYVRTHVDKLETTYDEGHLTVMYFPEFRSWKGGRKYGLKRIPAVHRVALYLSQSNGPIEALAAQQLLNTDSSNPGEWFNLPARNLLSTSDGQPRIIVLPKTRAGLHAAISFEFFAPTLKSRWTFILLLGITERGDLAYKLAKSRRIFRDESDYLNVHSWRGDGHSYTDKSDHERWQPLDLTASFQDPKLIGEQDSLVDVCDEAESGVEVDLKAGLTYGETIQGRFGDGRYVECTFEVVVKESSGGSEAGHSDTRDFSDTTD